MRIFNSVAAGAIAFSLIVTLAFLLVTLKTYVKGVSKTELGASRIRRFFIFFTISYTYLALLEIYATSKVWNLTVNPLEWPTAIFNFLISVEFFYDICAIMYLVSIHHTNFKPRKPRKQYFFESS